MFDFHCVNRNKNSVEKWDGKITEFKNYGTHLEFRIISRSSILVLFGKTSQGAFACIPDFGAGCHLVDPRDQLWNTARLCRLLGKVDGITLATAIFSISNRLGF